MFVDDAWVEGLAKQQRRRLRQWLRSSQRLVVVELGAGIDIRAVRAFAHEAIIEHQAILVRINQRQPVVPGSQHVSIAAPALSRLLQIEEGLRSI